MLSFPFFCIDALPLSGRFHLQGKPTVYVDCTTINISKKPLFARASGKDLSDLQIEEGALF
jgi:hypothetical protein